ncbi:MAG: MFS transporter, partial [Mycobacterium sp.]
MDSSPAQPASVAGRRSDGLGALTADAGTLAAEEEAVVDEAVVDEAAPPEAKARLNKADRLVLTIVCLAQFMVVLDISIVNVALPSIQKDLHFTAANLQWVVTAYSLTFGGLLLLGGRLADLFGRRRIFLLGLVLFT